MNPKREAAINAVLDAQESVFRSMQDGNAAEWLQLELTMAQVKALFALRRAGAITVGGLAEQLHVGLPAASILTEKLVQMGLVERREDSTDRRRTFIQLTPKAEELVIRLRQGRRERLHEWLAALSEADLSALTRGMKALAQVAAAK